MNYTFTLYLNETVDLTRTYYNFDGYRPGAHMVKAYVGPILANDAHEALEELFEAFDGSQGVGEVGEPVGTGGRRTGDHPVDYKHRSLSVGDVIVLRDETGTETAYSCESVGWKEVANFDPSVKNPAWIDRETYHSDPDTYEAIIRKNRSKTVTHHLNNNVNDNEINNLKVVSPFDTPMEDHICHD